MQQPSLYINSQHSVIMTEIKCKWKNEKCKVQSWKKFRTLNSQTPKLLPNERLFIIDIKLCRKIVFLATMMILIFSGSFAAIATENITDEVELNTMHERPEIVINEFNESFIELYNNGSTDVYLGNWVITDNDGPDDFVIPNLNITIKSHEFIVIYTGYGKNTTTTFYMQKEKSPFNTNGDDIMLLDSHRNVVDYICYGNSIWIDYDYSGKYKDKCINANLTEQKSFARLPDGFDNNRRSDWFDAQPTPGSKNQQIKKEVYKGDTTLLLTGFYYNGLTENDEFVLLTNTGNRTINLKNWSISDGEGILILPEYNLSEGKSIYVVGNMTSFSRYFENVTVISVGSGVESGWGSMLSVEKVGTFILANTGDELFLRSPDGVLIDMVIYGESNYTGVGWNGPPIPEVSKGRYNLRNMVNGKYIDTNSSADWFSYRTYKIGRNVIEPREFIVNNLTLFVNPDNSFDVIKNELELAKKEVLINIYSLTHHEIGNTLISLLKKNVTMKIMIDCSPVGGLPKVTLELLYKFVYNGATVYCYVDATSTLFARYRYDHAKYIVIDSFTTIIMSENLVNSGVAYNNLSGNRGWGVVIRNPLTGDYFRTLFFKDVNSMMNDVRRLSIEDLAPPAIEFLDSKKIVERNYKPFMESKNITTNVTIFPIIGPEHILTENDPLLSVLRNANKSILIEMMYIYKNWKDGLINPYLTELINASRRDVEIRIILDNNSDEYVYQKNLETLEYLSKFSVNVKLVNLSAHNLYRIHNKGLIVDGIYTFISSINWNYNSMQENREVGVLIKSAEVASYYTSVFEQDWKDDITEPKIILKYPQRIYVNQSIVFDGSYTKDDTQVTFIWLINGNEISKNSSLLTYRFVTPGIYELTLEVVDSWGNVNRTKRVLIVAPLTENIETKYPVNTPINIQRLVLVIPVIGLAYLSALLLTRRREIKRIMKRRDRYSYDELMRYINKKKKR